MLLTLFVILFNRTIFVRLSSLLVLLGSLYRVISNCTTAVDESSSGDSCTLNKITHTILTNNTDDAQIDCPVVNRLLINATSCMNADLYYCN